MLTNDEKKECTRLLKWDKEYKKRNNPVGLLVFITLIGGVYLFVQIPTGSTVLDYPQYAYSSIVVFLIGWGFAAYLSRSAKKLKISGYQKYIVKAYKAHDHLEQYEIDQIQNHADKAQNELESLLVDLELVFPRGEESSLKSLSTPIKELLDKIDFRLIPAIANEESRDIQKIKNSLVELIRFFQNENFDYIKKVNKDLEQYADVSEEESSFKEKLLGTKAGKISLSIISALIIGGVAVGIAYVAGGDKQTLITVGAAITIGSAAILINRVK